jgi:hypothetical protein
MFQMLLLANGHFSGLRVVGAVVVVVVVVVGDVVVVVVVVGDVVVVGTSVVTGLAFGLALMFDVFNV